MEDDEIIQLAKKENRILITKDVPLTQNFFGIFFINSSSVSSGVFVFTKPSLFEILCTCISTGIAGLSYAYTKTQFAVFLPTPGNLSSSSMDDGTLPLYFELIIEATLIIRLAFTW